MVAKAKEDIGGADCHKCNQPYLSRWRNHEKEGGWISMVLLDSTNHKVCLECDLPGHPQKKFTVIERIVHN